MAYYNVAMLPCCYLQHINLLKPIALVVHGKVARWQHGMYTGTDIIMEKITLNELNEQ